jgi:hypothetical protein
VAFRFAKGRLFAERKATCRGTLLCHVGKNTHLLCRPQALIPFDDEPITRGKRCIDLDRIAITVPFGDRDRFDATVVPNAEDHRMAARSNDRILTHQQRRVPIAVENDLGQHALLE